MKIGERDVAVVLSEAGQQLLKALNLPDSAIQWIYVQDADDLGIWARVPREDGNHFVLIRWDFVLGLDFPAGQTKTIGIKG
ncbi:MAG: hypothetical protein ABSD98_17490 [Candidatus Korobacteraceae bacterium]